MRRFLTVLFWWGTIPLLIFSLWALFQLQAHASLVLAWFVQLAALVWQLIILSILAGSATLVWKAWRSYDLHQLERKAKQVAIEKEQHTMRLEQQRFTLTRELAQAGKLDGSNVRLSDFEVTRFISAGRVTINETNSPQLALPAPAIPTFAQMLTTRQVTPYEDTSILGYTDGKPRTGQWAQLHSFMALGISGSGKSSTVAYYVALAVLHGARLLIIDPDAEEDDSLVQRLHPLSFAFLCPPGVDAKSASRILDIAEQELESPCAYPVVWCVDEFSTIMRMGEKNLGAWGDIAGRLALTMEDWAQRGRKRKRTVIAIGQIGKASRTGGTELRASMTATFVHRLSTQQARLVLDGPDAKLCPTLDTGEVVVLLANSVETYRMHIPYTQPADMVSVARLMAPATSSSVRQFNGGSGPETPPDLHALNSPRTDTELAWQAKIDRVRELHTAGRNQGQIIYQVWGVSKGGSTEYARAREEYLQIVAQLNAEEA